MNLESRLININKTFGPYGSITITNNVDYTTVTVTAYTKERLPISYRQSILTDNIELLGDGLIEQAIDYCIYQLAQEEEVELASEASF